jgi:hypothetical protein
MFLILWASSSYCFGYEDKDINNLASDEDVKNLLRRENIDSTWVAWSDIDPHCSNITKGMKLAYYHQCRFKNAYNASIFKRDAKICYKDAETIYPSELVGKNFQSSEIFDFVDNFGNIRQILQPNFQFSDIDLKRMQGATYRKCMREFGWIDPDNYLPGKK